MFLNPNIFFQFENLQEQVNAAIFVENLAYKIAYKFMEIWAYFGRKLHTDS